MNFINGKDEHEISLIDRDGKVLGKGYLFETIASKLYQKPRVNYFIDMDIEVKEKAEEIRKRIAEELVNRAKKRRKHYPDYDARVYHCCFSDDREKIRFYSSLKGFKHDEGMHILTHNLEKIQHQIHRNVNYEIKENSLNSEEEILEFINEHSKVFKGPYSIGEINELKEKEGFKNIGVYDREKIVGNILLIVEKEDKKYGWVEDMFVKEGYRTQGLGALLINKGLEHFRLLGLDESRLEVWSANERAVKLYRKIGYEFLQETQASIGASI